MSQNIRKNQRSQATQRMRAGPRTQVACINCKQRKLKCDDHVPACANCSRYSLICLVEDPATKRHQPRNYLETLEERVAVLEGLLQQVRQPAASPPEAPSNPNETASKQNNEEDDLSDLSSKVGMLDLNASRAEPRYLGSSSAFAFSRMINLSLRQLNPAKPNMKFQLTKDDFALSSPCLLPDYDVGITLSNAYFQNIHPQYPFLHEPTFRLWEMNLMWPSETIDALAFDPIPFFFVNMVYAVGALLLPNSGSLPQQLYVSAQLYMDHVLSFDNLESIQAILCCAMYSLRSPAGPSIWKLSGQALRQCIELGYHRSAERFGTIADPLRLELRKRVFWCAYGIDCAAALHLGRPMGVPQQEVDAEFPMDIDDSCITETGIYGTPRGSTNHATTMSTAIHVSRLRILWARIHTSLYSDTKMSNPGHPSYDERIQELRSELEEWISSAPPIIPRVGDALSIFGSRDWYDLNYNHSIILLYRGRLTNGKSVANSVFLECLKAAESICHGYRRQYIGKPVKYTWGSLHFLFLAGLTYLHCLWTSPFVRETVRHDDMSKTCTDCTIVLVMMTVQWEGAAPYRDIFEALASRTMTMMVNKNQEWDLVPASSMLSDGLNQEDLTQWMADIADVGMSDGIDRLLTGLVGDFTSREQEMSSQVGL